MKSQKTYYFFNVMPISAGWKFACVIYVALFVFIPEVFALVGQEQFGLMSSIAILLLCLAANSLMLAPLILSRFCGTATGWLHPLVLPTVIYLATDVIADPLTLVEPY